MAVFGDFTDTTQTLIREFGYPAVCLFTFFETSLLFPLLPSEVILPFAAAVLVDGPATLALFVGTTTIGSTVGSVFAYHAFGRKGSDAVDRVVGQMGVSTSELERGQRWFSRWGESSVLWGRLLPVLRSIISVPAGFADMDVGKFTVYSAVGSGAFNALVGAVVYYGKQRAVYGTVVSWVAASVPGGEHVVANPVLAAVALLALGGATYYGWQQWRADAA